MAEATGNQAPNQGQMNPVPTSHRNRQSTNGERTSRYRQAADVAIENLDWCINYLHQIRKHRIANALRKNRMVIVRRYRGH
jgi:hypothetical protein